LNKTGGLLILTALLRFVLVVALALVLVLIYKKKNRMIVVYAAVTACVKTNHSPLTLRTVGKNKNGADLTRNLRHFFTL
jgi:hypothetical protein